MFHSDLAKLEQLQGGELVVREMEILVGVEAHQIVDQQARGQGRVREKRRLDRWRRRQKQRCPAR